MLKTVVIAVALLIGASGVAFARGGGGHDSGNGGHSSSSHHHHHAMEKCGGKVKTHCYY